MSKIYVQKCTGEERPLERWFPAYEEAARLINIDLPKSEHVTADELLTRAINDGDILFVRDE